jgi:hypothetical protein
LLIGLFLAVACDAVATLEHCQASAASVVIGRPSDLDGRLVPPGAE